MFGDLPSPTPSKQVPPTTDSVLAAKRKPDLFGNDDLFDDPPVLRTRKQKVGKPLDDDLFGEETDKPSAKTSVHVAKDDDLFGDLDKPVKQPPVDEYIFGDTGKPVKPVNKVKKVESNVTVGKPVEKASKSLDDDLFGDEPPKKTTKLPPLSADLFEDKAPSKKPSEEVEEDLFASLGPTPKQKTVIKESVKPANPVEDDLFDEPVKEPTPATAPEPKMKSIFSDAPDLNKETTAEEDSKKKEDDLFASSPPAMKIPDKTVEHYA